MSMLTDFSPRRPDLWPMLAPELFEVYRVGATSADVKEGSIFPTRLWRYRGKLVTVGSGG
jgi:hypothetical protein